MGARPVLAAGIAQRTGVTSAGDEFSPTVDTQTETPVSAVRIEITVRPHTDRSSDEAQVSGNGAPARRASGVLPAGRALGVVAAVSAGALVPSTIE